MRRAEGRAFVERIALGLRQRGQILLIRLGCFEHAELVDHLPGT